MQLRNHEQRIIKRASQKVQKRCLKYSVSADNGKDQFDICVSVIEMDQQVRVIAAKSFKNSDFGFNEFVKWQKIKCK